MGWLDSVERAIADGDSRLSDPAARARATLLAGAADAHGYPEHPACSRCGATPAGELADCGDPACPLEGDRE